MKIEEIVDMEHFSIVVVLMYNIAVLFYLGLCMCAHAKDKCVRNIPPRAHTSFVRCVHPEVFFMIKHFYLVNIDRRRLRRSTSKCGNCYF